MCNPIHDQTASEKNSPSSKRSFRFKMEKSREDADFLKSFQALDSPVMLVRCKSESNVSAGNSIPGLKSITRLWRKYPEESESQDSTPRTLQARGYSTDPCSDLSERFSLRTKQCEEQRFNAEDVKKRWRNQQIAIQRKLVGELKVSWTSWLLRKRTPFHFLHRARSE